MFSKFKKIKFYHHVYSIFRKELENINKQEKSILLWNNDDNYLKIMIVLQHKITIFNKEKNQPIKISYINLPENFKEMEIHYDLLKDNILIMKEDGIIMDSQHIIEFMNNNFRNSIQYYGLNRYEVSQIFESILIDNKSFFKNNPPATVVENMANKWID